MGARPNPPPGNFDIPDLDLGGPSLPAPNAPKPSNPVASPAASTAPPKAPAAPSGSPLDYFGTGFDEDHFGGSAQVPDITARAPSGAYSGGSLDLDGDEDHAAVNLELGGSYHPPAFEGSAPPPAVPSAPPVPGSLPPQRSRAPAAPAPPPVDAGAVALLARYGRAPTGIHLAPLYAYRVLSRKRELARDLTRVASELEQKEAEVDELYAGVASGLRASLERDPRFEAIFASVRQLEAIAGERSQALAQKNEAYRRELDALHEQLRAVEAQLPALEQQKEAAASALHAREESLNRVLARQKRFLIEARSARMSAQQGAGPNAPVPAEVAAHIQALEAQAATIQPEVDRERQTLAEAQATLQNVRNQMGALGQHARRILGQEKALTRQFQGQLNQASSGFSTAQRELNRALAEVGRGVVQKNEAGSVDAEMLSAIRSAEAEVSRLGESNTLHLAALDAYDQNVVKRGIVLVVALAAAVVVGVVALAAFSGGSAPADAPKTHGTE